MADVFVMAISNQDNDAYCIEFDELHGIEFPTISGVEGGGDAINNTYGITMYPTYILIAPDHSIVEQDIWPVPSAQTFITKFENHGIEESSCDETLTASFTSDVTEICEFNIVNFSDASTGGATEWTWTFEGGDPATSNEENPIVTYSTVGSYDVTLEVSDGTNTNSITETGYISVITAPEPPETPAGEAEACSNYGLTYEYTVASVVNANSYEWVIAPAEAGNISGTGLTGSVVWTADWTGTATIQVKAMNECDDSGLSGAFDVEASVCTGIADNINEGNLNVYPNPNSGSFTFELNGFNNEVIVTVHNALGKVIHRSDKLKVNGNYSKTIDLDAEAGIYYMHIEGENVLINKKVIIRK